MEITQKQILKGQEVYQDLVKKAWQDNCFKTQLVNDPEVTLKEYLGVETEFNIVVEDQTNKSVIYLNIPRKITSEELLLTDEQLDMISGGDKSPAEDLGYFLANMHVNMLLVGATLIQKAFK